MDLPGVTRGGLARAILRWYSHNGRPLPWRDISDPYRILLSEIMLQQTTVSRVLAKYPEFLKRFPSIRKLAASSQKDVVVAWQGMGYNNRAVRLYRLAKTIVQDYGGKFPQSYMELLALPGVGRYTANALLSSAFRNDAPIVDVNIWRVLSRIFRPMKTTAALRPQNQIWQLAGRLIPRGNAYRWNQALMDLGATICIARSPHCERCPVRNLCASRKSMKRIVPGSEKRESSVVAIPNRIYRGRIIEALRVTSRSRNLRTAAIRRAIHPQYGRNSRRWLESLLRGLEKDGLIKRTGTGKWDEQRVSLA